MFIYTFLGLNLFIDQTAEHLIMELMDKLKTMLIRHEGLSLKPYRDISGNFTIGVGRNLDDVGISEVEADVLLTNDILRVTTLASSSFYWFQFLGDARKDAVLSMIFNLGILGFKKFEKLHKAIEDGDFELASKEMLESKWATQVGERAIELSFMMRTGTYLLLNS